MLARFVSSVRPTYSLVRGIRPLPLLAEDVKRHVPVEEIFAECTADSFERHKAWLIETIPHMPERLICHCLKAMRNATLWSSDVSPEIASVFIKEVRKRFKANNNTHFSLFYFAAMNSQMFKRFNLDFQSAALDIIQMTATTDQLQQQGFEGIVYLLEAIACLEEREIKTQTCYITRSGSEVINMIELYLSHSMKKNTIDENVAVELLMGLVKFDRSDEELVRKLEEITFHQCNKIFDENLSQLPHSYYRRERSDCSYMYESVLHPMTSEIIQRRKSFPAHLFNTFLAGLITKANKSGLYYHENLKGMLEAMVKEGGFKTHHEIDNRNFLLQTFNIASSTIPSLFIDTFRAASDILDKSSQNHKSLFGLKMALGFCKVNMFDIKFWDLFEINERMLETNLKYKLLFKSLLILLSSSNPNLYQRYLSIAGDKLHLVESAWKKRRYEEIEEDSWAHTLINSYLASNGISFTTNHFDEYIYSFAIPEKKVVVDLLKPKDYVLPDLVLSGRAVNKNNAILNKGWKVVSLPMRNLTQKIIEAKLSEQVLPLLRN